MTINVSTLGGGGGAGFKLAPDLDFFANSVVNLSSPFLRISNINGSAGFATALSLTGKWVVSALSFSDLTSESMTIRLTVDGVVIWNSSRQSSTSFTLLGVAPAATVGCYDVPIICDSSLLLEIQTTADTAVTLNYLARPIL